MDNNIKLLLEKKRKENNIISIGFSSCLIGVKCGWDGSDYSIQIVEKIYNLTNISKVHFCPEHLFLGTPREFSSIHGGTGNDVLDGKAKVLTVTGKDLTDESIKSAYQTLKLFKEKDVLISIMTEISPTCGSNAIYTGNPEKKEYIKGAGVTASLLRRNGICVIGQRETRTLNALIKILDPSSEIDENAINFSQDEWFTTYFKN